MRTRTHYLRRAVAAWRDEPGIQILGNLDAERLSIVSFVVKAPSGRYLHHNYVVALLNDLFGIQSRGGCSCAGPYGHHLLGIGLDRSHEFEAEVIGHGCEGIKPGWVRVNFNYFISEPVFAYIVEAVRLVARDGWRLLRDYRFNPATGLWKHHRGPVEPPLRLSQVGYDADGRLCYPHHEDTAPESVLQTYLDEARALFATAAAVDSSDDEGTVNAGLRQPPLVRSPRHLPHDLGGVLRIVGEASRCPTECRAAHRRSAGHPPSGNRRGGSGGSRWGRGARTRRSRRWCGYGAASGTTP